MSDKDVIILGCSSQQPTRRRNHGAYLFRWNEEGMLFDPGEGTQRQFIYADVAPPTVTRIFISHFHGDHCLGFGSMLMRLNLDKVTHPIHCYYPASGKKYFDRLRYAAVYHEKINVVEHPVEKNGIVHDDGKFCVEAKFLNHGIDNVGWRITEADQTKFIKEKLDSYGIKGPMVRKLQEEKNLTIDGKIVPLENVSFIRKGESIAIVIDTLPCPQAIELARDAVILLCESTYLEKEKELAGKYHHMTAMQAALIAKEANVKKLIMTHFSARYKDLSPFEIEARQIFKHSYAADDLKRFSFPKKFN